MDNELKLLYKTLLQYKFKVYSQVSCKNAITICLERDDFGLTVWLNNKPFNGIDYKRLFKLYDEAYK